MASSSRVQDIYLLGNTEPQIVGNKLPSKEQVLKVLFHNIREVNPRENLRVSAKLVIDEVKVFWAKARLPVQKESRCIEKLIDLHEKWCKLRESISKPSNREKEQKFISELKGLFDISHGNILEEIDDKRREFFENQRKEGRIGYINDIAGLIERQQEEENRQEEMLSRRLARSKMEMNILGKI